MTKRIYIYPQWVISISEATGRSCSAIADDARSRNAPRDVGAYSEWLAARVERRAIYRSQKKERRKAYDSLERVKEMARANDKKCRASPQRKAYMKAYCAKPENLARIRANQRKMDNDRRRNDPAYCIKNRLRSRFHKALKAGLASKAWRTSELLGCDPAQLKQHIESQFITGMSWNNRHAWHVDHIIPLSAFNLTDPEEQKRACHFTNLKPLWAKLNQKKHARLPASPQPQLRLEYLIQSSSKPSALAVPHFMQAVA